MAGARAAVLGGSGIGKEAMGGGGGEAVSLTPTPSMRGPWYGCTGKVVLVFEDNARKVGGPGCRMVVGQAVAWWRAGLQHGGDSGCSMVEGRAVAWWWVRLETQCSTVG